MEYMTARQFDSQMYGLFAIDRSRLFLARRAEVQGREDSDGG